MSFIINQNFDLKSPQFNFARDYFADLEALKAACGGDWTKANYSSFPNHFITSVGGILYQYNKDYSVDTNSGKWRRYKPTNATYADTAGSATSAATATKANTAKTADSATSATTAGSATKATQDENGRNIVLTYLTKTSAENTYATKSLVSALSSALVYKGTIGTGGTITKTDVSAKVGDVYVAITGAPSVNGVALEAGDMIIAKTAGDGTTTHATWTAVQTNINGAVTTSSTLSDGKLIIGGGGTSIRTASTTGFVKITDGNVSVDNSTYLKSVPAATDTSVGGIKAENIGTFQPGFTVTEQNQVIDSFTSTTSPSNKIYPVELFYNGRAFVRVPWTDTNTTYPLASASANGLMSKDDKSKLDDLGLSGDSFNDASTNTKGLRLNLVGADSSYDIPIVKPSNDASTYGLMSGADKKKLDGLQNYTLSVATTNKLGGIEIGFAKNDAAKNYPVELSGNKAYVHVPWVDTNTNTTYTADGTYVTLTGTLFSLAHDKKTLIDNAIQSTSLGTSDQFDYLYHEITKNLNNKYVCKSLTKSYVTVNIVTGKTVNAGAANVSGPLVFCNNGTATTDGTIRGLFGQQKSIIDTSVYGNDVTWALDDSSNVIVIDQNGKEYTITPKGRNDYCVLTPRAIQSTEITTLFN